MGNDTNTYSEKQVLPDSEYIPPYRKYFVETQDENGVLTNISYVNQSNFNFAFDVVDYIAKYKPDKLAMLHIGEDHTERKFSFRDMSLYSNMTANYFASLGIHKGSRVMLVLKRNYQFWFSILALHKLGAIVIPTCNLLLEKDFVYRIQTADINAIVCTSSGNIADVIDQAISSIEENPTRIIVGNQREGWHYFDEEFKQYSNIFERPTKDESVSEKDPMLMFFTSGTTSHPKITLHNFLYPLGHYVTAKYWQRVNPNGLHLSLADTGWAKALWGKIYGQWLLEAPIFVYDYTNFNATEILKYIEQYKITTFCAPPTLFRVIVCLNLKEFNLSSLEHVTTAGEALNPIIFDKFLNATGLQIFEGFGQSETTLTIGNFDDSCPKNGSLGKPNPSYHISIMKPDGTKAATNEVGEIVICVKESTPPGLFLEYYGDEELTKRTWYDGYYHTGDTAYEDEDGYYWYVGRVDDLIKSAGYRVSPFEIESELMKIPFIMECAVTSVPDNKRGQAIKASVVLKKEFVETQELRNEFFTYVSGHLASYQRPKLLSIVPELPKTTSGKIQRALIKAKDWNKVK